MVETPVSSLRSDDFGYSGFEHVLKSATAGVRDGPAGFAAGAGGASGTAGALLISVVAGFVCVVAAITFCCGGGV